MSSLHIVTESSDTPCRNRGHDGAMIYLDKHSQVTQICESAINTALSNRQDACAVYGDIEISGTVHRRPAWSPTRLLSEPATCLPIAVRCTTLAEIDCTISDPSLVFRLVESRAKVLHLPAVLSRHSQPPQGGGAREINSHLDTIGLPATSVEDSTRGGFLLIPKRSHQPPLSVVVPTAGTTLDGTPDADFVVNQCLKRIALARTKNIEVILVVGDEFHGDPSTINTFGIAVKILERPPGPFNFSLACNQGILAAQNELVLLLNDDVEIDADAIDAMAVHFGDPSVGVVGAMLRYPDGTIQHAGIILDNGHPLHPFLGWQPEKSKPYGGNVARDVIAVTGACVMSRRRLLLSLGGLSTVFPLSYSDIDLCLRIRRSGYRVIIEAGATAMHHESLSRTPRIYDWEWERWIERWGDIVDPWYHPDYHRPDQAQQLNLNADHLEPLAHRDRFTARDTKITPASYYGRPLHAPAKEPESQPMHDRRENLVQQSL